MRWEPLNLAEEGQDIGRIMRGFVLSCCHSYVSRVLPTQRWSVYLRGIAADFPRPTSNTPPFLGSRVLILWPYHQPFSPTSAPHLLTEQVRNLVEDCDGIIIAGNRFSPGFPGKPALQTSDP